MNDLTISLLLGDLVTFAPLILAVASFILLIFNLKEDTIQSKVVFSITAILILIGSLYSLGRIISWFPEIFAASEDFFFEPFNVVVYTFFEIPHALLLAFLSWVFFKRSNVLGKVAAILGLMASSAFTLLWIIFWIRLFL